MSWPRRTARSTVGGLRDLSPGGAATIGWSCPARAEDAPATVDLVCHVRGDGDLLHAWLDHYVALGVTRFHFIAHGRKSDNEALYRLPPRYPAVIVDAYDGVFHDVEKQRRVQAVLTGLRGRWVVTVDSDEMLELPYEDLPTTISMLERLKATALSAPMVQRLREDGRLETPEVIADPFGAMPLCAPALYATMGVEACIAKYPLFLNTDTVVVNPGYHVRPDGRRTRLSGLRGVTHHFKWRAPVLQRLRERADSGHAFRHESAGYLAYLGVHGYRLPVTGAFRHSRKRLFRRGLLRSARGRDWMRLFVGSLRSAPATR